MSDEPKVLLTFEDGDIIVAKRFGYIDGNMIGVMAASDDGSHQLFAVSTNPTNAELYGITVAADASYEEKSKAIESAMEELDDREEDLPDVSTLAQINEWLSAEVDLDEDQLEQWGARASQYAPGFAIIDALSVDEQKALGLSESDLGGPASYLPCVSTTASIDELNRVLAAKRLPFIFIDDEGPEEG